MNGNSVLKPPVGIIIHRSYVYTLFFLTNLCMLQPD